MSTKIYIKLMNEGTNVWRPVEAKKINKSIYLILPNDNYDFADDDLEFLPGTKVYCDHQEKSIGNILVAIRKAN